MSSTGPMQERVVTAVLLSLWKRGAEQQSAGRGGGATAAQEVSIQQLLQDTLAPLPDVQQALELLSRRRCLIERTPAGVRLVSTSLPCWSDILEDLARRERLRLGRRVMVFLRTRSTNDIAWQCAANPECDGLVVVADEQTAGRGRLGHSWLARPEQSILLSLLLRDVPDASVDRLTLLAGLAAAQSLEQVARAAGAGLRVEIKWPNDLLVQGRKIAGILVERRPGAGRSGGNRGHVVVGIGINVSQGAGDFAPELAGRAVSLYEATGLMIDRLRVVAAFLRQFDAALAAHGSGAAGLSWIEEWKSRCSMLGTHICVRTGAPGRADNAGERQAGGDGGILAGEVLDVDPMQGLLLRDAGGATHFLSAQTTTLDC